MGALVDRTSETDRFIERLRLANAELGRLDDFDDFSFGPASRGTRTVGLGGGGGGGGGLVSLDRVERSQREQFLALNDIQSKLDAILRESGISLNTTLRSGR